MEKEYKDLLVGIANHLVKLQEITILNGRKNAYVKAQEFDEASILKIETDKLIQELPNIKELLEKCNKFKVKI